LNHFDAIIIGGGQAGLSTGYYLSKTSLKFIILEKDNIGDIWRSRYDSLELFSPAEFNNLPGKSFPAEKGSFPVKDDTALYLEEYAVELSLPVKTGENVKELTREGDKFKVTTDNGIYLADQVVIATGAFQTPFIPSSSKLLSKDVYQIHSSQYRNPTRLPEGKILVVGTGSSGVQIAIEIAREKDVYLSGRDMSSVPRKILGKDFYWWWYKTGLATMRKKSLLGRYYYRRAAKKGDLLVGLSMGDVEANERINRVSRIKGVEKETIILEDGSLTDVKVIIWATGFKNDYTWVKLDIFDESGNPVHDRGVVTSSRGIYFTGLKWLYRMNSSILGGVGRDAKYISRIIEQRRRNIGS